MDAPTQTSAYAIDVWYCKSIIARIIGGLAVVAQRARLEWNTDTQQVRLTRIGNQGDVKEEIFLAHASDFAYASVSIDLVYLKMKNKKSYQFQPRSAAISAAYVATYGGWTSNILGSIQLQQEGLPILLDMLSRAGVRVAKANVLRGILIGLAIGTLLFIGFFSFLIISTRT